MYSIMYYPKSGKAKHIKGRSTIYKKGSTISIYKFL